MGLPPYAKKNRRAGNCPSGGKVLIIQLYINQLYEY